jgi:hypothetical protein
LLQQAAEQERQNASVETFKVGLLITLALVLNSIASIVLTAVFLQRSIIDKVIY